MRLACSALVLAACVEAPPDELAVGRVADPAVLAIEASGTWPGVGPDGTPFDRAWVDVRVANLRYDKRVLVEVAAPGEHGWVRTIHVAGYEGPLGDGPGSHERWGVDTIELFAPTGPVVARARYQDGDAMLVTAWTRLAGDGALDAPVDDPWLELDAPVAPDGAPADVVFAPFDDPGRTLLAEIAAITERQRAAPGERHTLHLAVYNVTDPELVAALVAAHDAGVEVRVIFDGRKLRPWYGWYTGDDALLAAGVPVLGAFRPGGAMHDKLVLLDGRRVATGSFNWETGARLDNHEALLTTGDPDLVRAYADRFGALAGGPLAPRAGAADPAAPASVHFAPDEAPHRVLGDLIDGATRSIHVAMFTCKDIAWDGTSLFAKLAAARRRGVDVTIVVDHGVHEASEYHGVETPDDPSDEWLEAQGIHVVRADNPRGAYASMHDKLAVIDGEIVVAGAYNWYFDAAFRNDEDLLVLRDPALAARVTGELVALLAEYDPAFDPAAWPAVTLHLDVLHDRTRWGDTVAVAGSVPALGAWSPAAALPLDPAAWPRWRADLTLPAGLHLTWKVVTLHPDGSVTWEPGADRRLTAPTGVAEATVTAVAR